MRKLIVTFVFVCGCSIGLEPMNPGWPYDTGAPNNDPENPGPGPRDSGTPTGDTGQDCVDIDGDGNTDCDGDCNDNDASLNLNDDDNDGYSTCDNDCDDDDRFTFPGAAEHESASTCMTDFDEDGYGSDAPGNGINAGSDCSDGDSAINPGENDVAWDGIDQDCSGSDAGSTQTSTNNTTNTISDNSTVNSITSISSCPTIYDIEVDVNITHTYIGDLTVTLTGPSGDSATLHNRTGSGTNNLIGTYAISGGTLTASQSLTRFLNVNGNGQWRLTVRDNASADTGRLNSWTVTLGCP